jgi:two-component system cell cycle sensor histidine kinase/response regulator CckA
MPMRNTTTQTRHTVLVVEDERLMRRLLQRVLSRQDTSVLLAADGEEALDVYRHHKDEINVVLLDLGLPKISGWEVFNNLKRENPDLSIVVASGYMEPEIKSRMHDAGVEHFIEKPYRLEQLVETLVGVMEHG